eukprot:GABV01014901.1.p1 GENE.GABV01014901.1~~GABV01014901.1.p1  ORF type:complete len:106 (-),score=35.13 GABV01014901.1:3-320(-)
MPRTSKNAKTPDVTLRNSGFVFKDSNDAISIGDGVKIFKRKAKDSSGAPALLVEGKLTKVDTDAGYVVPFGSPGTEGGVKIWKASVRTGVYTIIKATCPSETLDA